MDALLARMSVRNRLRLLCAVFLGVIALVFSMGALLARAETAALRNVYEGSVVPLTQLRTIADQYAVQMVDAAHKGADGTFTPAQALEAIGSARAIVEKEWSGFLASPRVQAEQQLIDRFLPLREAAERSIQVVEVALRQGDMAAVQRYTAEAMYPAFDPMQAVVSDLINLQLEQAAGEYQTGKRIARDGLLAMGAAALVALVIGLWIAHIIIARLDRSLGGEPRDVRAVAQAIAAGDLTVRVQTRDDSDTTSVMAAMKQMSEQLRQTVGTVMQNAQTVASASEEIAKGNQDLASRTEQQATALQQTASSMEQVGATVKNNTDHARDASALAQTAARVAGDGGQVVGKVVATMSEISQSSQRIGDIIGVIDGIAFQTNILALNAAVEAARAGEQGRGFAVVAGEVRSLAQRSAEAAREIKQLILESTGQVEAGVALVDRAGATMREVVGSIEQVARIVGHISEASREQSAGVQLMGESVHQLDQVTQQNVSMVEESAAAARSLNDQAHRMLEAILRFRLKPA
ncbi:methyl-accepting chemotaxis protein [Hydrogenophaga sp. XSHU_21]